MRSEDKDISETVLVKINKKSYLHATLLKNSYYKKIDTYNMWVEKT